MPLGAITAPVLQVMLSSPRVHLVDYLTMARDASRGRTSSSPLVGPGNLDCPDGPISWKMTRSTSAECSSDGCMSLLLTGNHPTMSVFPVASEFPDEHCTSTSSESCTSPVSFLGHGTPVVCITRGSSCSCRCHVWNGSCCPWHCSCSHWKVACQTD